MSHKRYLNIITSTDGLYTKDPSKNKDAKRIPVVEEITSEIDSHIKKYLVIYIIPHLI